MAATSSAVIRRPWDGGELWLLSAIRATRGRRTRPGNCPPWPSRWRLARRLGEAAVRRRLMDTPRLLPCSPGRKDGRLARPAPRRRRAVPPAPRFHPSSPSYDFTYSRRSAPLSPVTFRLPHAARASVSSSQPDLPPVYPLRRHNLSVSAMAVEEGGNRTPSGASYGADSALSAELRGKCSGEKRRVVKRAKRVLCAAFRGQTGY